MDLDFPQFEPMWDPVSDAQAHLDLSLPPDLLERLETRAEAAGLPTALYIRGLLERAVAP